MLRRSFLRCAKSVAEKPPAEPTVAVIKSAPKMLNNADVGGKSTWEIQKDMTEAEIKAWEVKWINENLPVHSQRDLNRYYTATQAPGFNGGSWRFDTTWMWKYNHQYAPWHSQQYLIGAGRNPGGWPWWGTIEYFKILLFEGWRIRRNLWRIATGVMVTGIAVEYRDIVWDPIKEGGTDGQVARRKAGKFVNWWGFPGFFTC